MTDFIIVPTLANHEGPVRRQPLVVRPNDGSHLARLTEVDDGVVVSICRENRLLSTEVIDAPLHVVADRVSQLLTKLNGGKFQ